VPDSFEAQPDAVVLKSDLFQAVPQTIAAQEINRRVLKHSGANAILHVVTASRLEHDGIDAVDTQQVREHESRGPGTDDADLRAR